MMKIDIVSREKWHALMAVVIMAVIAPAICSAEKITTYQNTWEPIEMVAKVESVSDEGDSLFLSNERTIVLVELKYQGRFYRTNIKDDDGRPIDFKEIKKGSWIFVRGGILPDLHIAARDIFLLPRETNINDLKKRDVFRSIESWEQPLR